MLRATKIVPAGIWHGTPADVVRLDYDRRTRRRIALTGTAGLAFLLDLGKAPVLRSGDGIRLDDGAILCQLRSQPADRGRDVVSVPLRVARH